MDSNLMLHRNACEAVRAHVAATPDAEALTYVTDLDAADGTRTWHYGALDERARTIAAALQSRYPAGSRVLLLFPTADHGVQSFVACLYAGMIAVFAPAVGRYRHERERVRIIARDAEVAGVLTDAASVASVTEWAAEQDLVDLDLDLDVVAVDELTDGSETWTPPGSTHDTPAMLQYTSGSTSDPKGVVVTHGNLLANVQDMIGVLGLPPRPRLGGWGPLHHDMGLMGQVTPPLFLGGAVVLMGSMTFLKRPHLWLRLIDRHNLYMSAAPNFAYELCTRRITDEQLAELDLSRWRLACNGSEPVHVPTMRAFSARFAAAGLREDAMTPCYGLAEATVLVSGTGAAAYRTCRVDPESLARNEFVPVAEGGQELASCGRTGDLTVRIVDPATARVLPDGEVGEVLVSGPSVADGYWENETATAAVFGVFTSDGGEDYLRTGDLGVLHEGELYLTGRIKEMLIFHGRNLYPQDVEQELRLQHPELAGLTGAAFTADFGTDPALVVVHEIRGKHDVEALTTRMKQTVAREFGVKVAAVVLVRPGAVRRTTSGKVQRTAMRRAYLDGELDPAGVPAFA